VDAGWRVIGAGKLKNIAAAQHGDEILQGLRKILTADVGDQTAIAFA